MAAAMHRRLARRESCRRARPLRLSCPLVPAPQGGGRRHRCRAWIGIGANLGEPASALRAAFAALSALPRTRLLARSSLYRSAPIDAGGPDYLNAVAQIATGLSAHELLAQLHAIEARHGRERPYRNAPRSMDLDLLLYADEVIASHGLVVPHPRLQQRAFVLVPMAELAPDLMIPGIGSIGGLLPAVADQAIEKLGGSRVGRP